MSWAPEWYWQRFGYIVIEPGCMGWAVVDDFGSLVRVCRHLQHRFGDQ